MNAMTLDEYKAEVKYDAYDYIDEHYKGYDAFNDLMDDMMSAKEVTGGAWGKLGVHDAEDATKDLMADEWFTEKLFPMLMGHEIDGDLPAVYQDVEIRRYCLQFQWADLRDHFTQKLKDDPELRGYRY